MILVTGGAGFIGSHVVEQLLEAGHRVAVLDDLSTGQAANLPRGVPVHVVDVRDAAAVLRVFGELRPVAVCHQAAQVSVSRSVREAPIDAQVNVLGTINVLEAAVRHDCRRVVLASSGGVVYGNVTQPAVEAAVREPVSPYGIAKLTSERYLAWYTQRYHMQAVALRYANVYGPRQSPHGEAGVVAIFCGRLLAGEPALIHGTGGQVRDYVHVRDVARANVLALQADLPYGTAYPVNVGTGVGTSVAQLEQLVRGHLEAVTGRPMPQPAMGKHRPGDLASSLVDASYAWDLLGWRPTVDLTAGIRETVRYFAQA